MPENPKDAPGTGLYLQCAWEITSTIGVAIYKAQRPGTSLARIQLIKHCIWRTDALRSHLLKSIEFLEMCADSEEGVESATN